MSNFNTEKVTNMSYMFYHCDSLINLDITKFKLDNVIKMNYMFSGCKKELQALVKNQNSGFKDSAFIKSYYKKIYNKIFDLFKKFNKII